MCFSIVTMDKSRGELWNCVFTEAFPLGTTLVSLKYVAVWQFDLIESYSIEIKLVHTYFSGFRPSYSSE